jgi:hypothetical protein
VRQPWPTKNGIGEKCLSLYSLLILIIPESGEFAENFIQKEPFFNPKQEYVANLKQRFPAWPIARFSQSSLAPAKNQHLTLHFFFFRFKPL